MDEVFSFNRRPSMWQEPAPPATVPASTVMMAADPAFTDRDFGSHGELLVPTPDSTVVVEPGPPLLIEPPPWAGREADLAIGAPPMTDQVSELGALAQMKLNSGDIDWPEAPGPPMVTPPLTRPRIPEVDWRAEETARVEETMAELESPGALLQHPAPKGRRWPGMP